MVNIANNSLYYCDNLCHCRQLFTLTLLSGDLSSETDFKALLGVSKNIGTVQTVLPPVITQKILRSGIVCIL